MKEQQRELPIIDVYGVPFYADAINSELIEVGNNSNRISAFEMLCFDDHYEFMFDRGTKAPYEGRWNQPIENKDVVTVWIRPISATDPEGMRSLIQEGKIRDMSDYLSRLPLTEFAGVPFYVDDNNKVFREVENPWNCISYFDVQQGEPCQIYFDTVLKNIPFPHEFDQEHPPEKLPAHIVLANAPSGEELAELLRETSKVKVKREATKDEQLKAKPLRKGRKL
jgi:hypothetical protein